MRGADLLVETLVDCGVRHLFSLSGNQILPLYDATIGRDIDIIHTRHEATAVHMADVWGRLTDEPGVAAVTAGPGHFNALSALYMARMAESPLVLLSGHAPIAQLGMGAFQEVDQVAGARPVTKAAWIVREASHLVADVRRAMRIATKGRPGPVHLSLPDDVSTAIVDGNVDNSCANADSADNVPTPPTLDGGQHEVEEMLGRIQAAERPLILAGSAMARGKRWQAAVDFATATASAILPMASPRGVNDPHLHMAVNKLNQADLVILAGKKLDFSLKFGQAPFSDGCKFIQIDADAEAETRTDSVLSFIHGDPLLLLGQAAALVRSQLAGDTRSAGGSEVDATTDRDAWASSVRAARSETPDHWQQLRTSTTRPIHPMRICAAVQPFLQDGAVFVSDGGEFGQWAQAGCESETRIINGPSGSIGSALPMALGAQLMYPDRPVFVFVGDGTFGFGAIELDTAVRYGLPITVIIGNDARWNAEVQLQTNNYGADRTVACELLPTRYDQVAVALGAHGQRVEDPEQLTPAIERALASGLPSCINVVIEPAPAPSLLGK